MNDCLTKFHASQYENEDGEFVDPRYTRDGEEISKFGDHIGQPFVIVGDKIFTEGFKDGATLFDAEDEE